MSRLTLCMLVFVLAAVAVTSAQFRCETPRQWEGDVLDGLTFGPQMLVQMASDAYNERYAATINSTFQPPVKTIILYKEQIEYDENLWTKTCSKGDLYNETFQDYIAIPPSARYVAPLYIGAESYGLGVKVDLWKVGEGFMAWTRQGCLPVFASVQNSGLDFAVTTFYNMKIGVDPDRFVPGPECT